MRFRAGIWSCLFSLALFSCAGVELPDEGGLQIPETVDESCIPGVMTVEFSEELTAQIEEGLKSGERPVTRSSPLNDIFDELGVTSLERVFPDAGEWEARHRKAGLHRWYRVHFDSNAVPGTKASDSMGSIPGVLNASPCRKVKTNAYFNDPLAFEQWHLCSPGASNNTGKYAWGADVNVEPVWANYTGGRSDVIVQVVDHGVDMQHPDLGSVTLPPGPEGSRTFCNEFPEYDLLSGNHGCHVAGIIAAINNNDKGVSGIAGGLDGNGGVSIMSCEIFRYVDGDKTYYGSGEEAIVWGADHGAVISNNSWGTDFDSEALARSARESEYAVTKAAVEYFNENAGTDADGNQIGPMKGGVVFFSAGNDGWRAGWPAKLDCVVAVGASSSLNLKTVYSNYGDWVDICAPGGDTDAGIWSCLDGGKYGSMNGTSMACPNVAGVAALIVSYFGGPGFTAEMLKERLLSGASYEKMPPSQNIGPLVDAYRSIALGSTVAPEPVSEVSLSSKSNRVTFKWTVPADADDKVAGSFLLVLSDKASDMEGISHNNLPTGVKSFTVPAGPAQVGDSVSWEFDGLDFSKDYYGVVFAHDVSGNFAEASPCASVTTEQNNPPVFDEVCDGLVTLKAHEILRFDISGHDPDSHAFSMSVDPGSKALTASEFHGNGVRLSISGRGAEPGEYSCTVTATDEYGCSSDFTFRYRILENHAPSASKPFEDIIFGKRNESVTIDIAEYVSDEDGEQLVYRVTPASTSVVNVRLEGSVVTLTAKSSGQTAVTVKVVDTCGDFYEDSFDVLLRDNGSPFDLYPNPVTGGWLNIRPSKNTEARVTVRSQSGAAVCETASSMDVFKPMRVDMSSLAAGVYFVTVSAGGADSTYQIVKL